jgi:hypothetical protein
MDSTNRIVAFEAARSGVVAEAAGAVVAGVAGVVSSAVFFAIGDILLSVVGVSAERLKRMQAACQ